MPKIIAWFLDKIGIGLAFRALYYGLLLLFVGAWASFVMYFISALGSLHNWINQALNMFQTGLAGDILGLLSCLGVIDGLNASLPIFLSVLATVIVINISKYFYDFSSKLLQFVGSLTQ